MTILPAALDLRAGGHRGLTAALLCVAMLSACATRVDGTASQATATPAFAIDQEVTLEGRVASVDTAPWAYDGSGILVVDSPAHGAVKVQLPARYNLCRATGIDTAAALKPGQRVRVSGTATDPDTLTVCEGPTHRIERY